MGFDLLKMFNWKIPLRDAVLAKGMKEFDEFAAENPFAVKYRDEVEAGARKWLNKMLKIEEPQADPVVHDFVE